MPPTKDPFATTRRVMSAAQILERERLNTANTATALRQHVLHLIAQAEGRFALPNHTFPECNLRVEGAE